MKVALIIVFNHNYEKNISVLKELYGKRFSTIYMLMPFYKGTDPAVIPVFENSRYFQGYFNQGFKSYFDPSVTHYFFIGDDLILNPAINENNYQEFFKLDSETSFVPTLSTLHERPEDDYWLRVRDAFAWRPSIRGAEMATVFPDYAKAEAQFGKYGLTIKPLKFSQVYNQLKNIQGLRAKYKWMKRYASLFKKRNNLRLQYPLVASYSDILIVSHNTIREFVHYCGIFTVAELFVELAAPTALVLTGNPIRTERELEKQGAAMWTKADYDRLNKYNYSLQALLNDFPSSNLYLHPIKLSKWK